MADEPIRPSSEASGVTPGDGAAAALGLSAASRAKADRFLDEQTRVAEAQAAFIRLQAEDFRADESVRRRTLRLEHSSAMMKVAFELAVALIALLLIIIVGSALWSASHDDGLVIESFSVPPDMASRGLTGDVVAARLLDKLAKLQAQTQSSRAASSYANNWGGDIKVQIPDTGVSIGQLYGYLAQWLGHQTHISGEITRDAGGTIAVTARVGADASPNFAGAEADFDKLLQQAAEAVYAKTQPYRYAVYLSNRGRQAEAETAYRALILDGSPKERAWAYVGLSTLYQSRGDIAGAIGALHRSLEAHPDFAMAYLDLAGMESTLQHDEASTRIERKLVDGIGAEADMDHRAAVLNLLQDQAGLATALGDFQAQLAYDRQAEQLPDFAGLLRSVRESDLTAYAFLHDAQGLRDTLAQMPVPVDFNAALNRNASLMSACYVLGQWRQMQTNTDKILTGLTAFGKLGDVFRFRVLMPLQAAALAAQGDFAGAKARIAGTPLDCDLCLRLRGRVAAAEHRWAASEYWFRRLSAHSPSSPFVDADWGQMLLEKGDPAGAIAEFTIANRKGPHFADPLEMWGEALMAQNRSDLALAKFADAGRYAPHWKRLHRKWGEALLYAGRKADAQKQFAIAAALPD